MLKVKDNKDIEEYSSEGQVLSESRLVSKGHVALQCQHGV